jgi:cytochrome c-type biogenesis protein CcmE
LRSGDPSLRSGGQKKNRGTKIRSGGLKKDKTNRKEQRVIKIKLRMTERAKKQASP